jgi:transposase
LKESKILASERGGWVITTDKQVRRLLKMSQDGMPLSKLAAKADMDVKTARKYLRAGRLPSQMKSPRDWRTREDPFADAWDEVKALLKESPELQALTIFQDLQRRNPGKFQDGQLRTLQRRIRIWRGLHGPDQEVYFPQIHYPGKISQSDFTWMNSLDIMIAGQLFPHMLYHFVLTYSNWEYAEICFSESFESLSRGLQNALWTLGGIPESHRTDHLGAAKFGGQEQEDFGANYMALMRHYGLTPTKNNPGESHENGDVEQSHYRLKQRVDQALLLRGSRNFSNRSDYEHFIWNIFTSKNRNRSRRFEQEREVLKDLPLCRLDDHRDYKVPVGAWSTVRVAHNTYSVPSRLIRHEVTARLYADYVEIHFAGQCICSMERFRGTGKARIDYRHIIGSLVRKPGAFENYRYREGMFPSTIFRQAYDRLVHDNPRRASRKYLEILEWAAINSESAMEAALRQLLESGEDLDFNRLVKLSERPFDKPLEIHIPLPNMTAYDELLKGVAV